MKPSIAALVVIALFAITVPAKSQQDDDCPQKVAAITGAISTHIKIADFEFAHKNYVAYQKILTGCIEAAHQSQYKPEMQTVLGVLANLRNAALQNPKDPRQANRLKAFDVVSFAMFGKSLEEMLNQPISDSGDPEVALWQAKALLEGSEISYLISVCDDSAQSSKGSKTIYTQ